MTISYTLEPELAVDEFIDVLQRSELAARRPVGDLDRIEKMLRHSDVTVAARNADGLLVGITRAITDFGYFTFLIDLAVDETYQRQGIGRTLIARTHEEAGLDTKLALHAAPDAEAYYSRVGMVAYDNCWRIPPPE